MESFLTRVRFSEWNLRADAGESFEDLWAEYLSNHSLEDRSAAELFLPRFLESISQPLEGNVRVLQSLKAEGHRLYGLTNWSAQTFPIAQAHYGFFGCFDQILVSGVEKLIKPDARFYALAEARFELEPSRTFFVDDRLDNVEAARQRGWQAFQLTDSHKLWSDIQTFKANL